MLVWCQAMGALPHDNIQIQVLLGNTIIAAQACPSMSHHWDITHVRWVPTIPQVGPAMAVLTTPLVGSSRMVVPPLLPQIGTAGHRSPNSMGVPPATMVGISASNTTSDDTVE